MPRPTPPTQHHFTIPHVMEIHDRRQAHERHARRQVRITLQAPPPRLPER